MIARDSHPDSLRKLLRRLALLLLAVGVFWRLLRYLLRFPLWEDEAFLCLNFLELDYAGLTHELRNCQIAPLFFLWGELTALRLLGPSEWAMRLLPFLAGMGSLLLFWRLARLTLPPLPRTLAVGMLAVAIWPVSMCSFTKPYSFDLFTALLLTLLAVRWLHRPHQTRWLLLLALALPLALFSSYPAVFVAGAVSLALMATAWRQGWKARLLWGLCNLTLIAGFLGHFLIAGRSQLRTPDHGVTTERGMQDYWAEGFPPSAPLPLAKWLLFAHTGQMMAFPIGAQDGGSSLTTILFLIGVGRFWRTRRRSLLVLCVAPFALGLIASVMHRYPYGASCRLCQHLAPAICLSAGMGAAVLIERIRSDALRRRWILGTCGALVLVGVIGMTRDTIRPYRSQEALWTRQVMRQLQAEARSGAPLVIFNKPEEIDALFRWYLEGYGDRLSWAGAIDWNRARSKGELLCLYYNYHSLNRPGEMPRAPTREALPISAGTVVLPEGGGQSWIFAQGATDTGVPPDWRFPVKHLHHFRLVLQTVSSAPACRQFRAASPTSAASLPDHLR